MTKTFECGLVLSETFFFSSAAFVIHLSIMCYSWVCEDCLNEHNINTKNQPFVGHAT